jgi:hypothetical protein
LLGLLLQGAPAPALDDLNRPRVYDLQPGMNWPPIYEIRPGMTGCGRDRPCDWQEPRSGDGDWRRRPGRGLNGDWRRRERGVNDYRQPQTDYDLAVPRERPVDPLPRGGRLDPYRDIVRPHNDWCQDRYRSYDRRTDTFQPYSGPRRRCVSPYR